MRSLPWNSTPCRRGIRTYPLATFFVVATFLIVGCKRDDAATQPAPAPSATTTTTKSSPPPATATPAAKQPELPAKPRVAVGEDPAVSLVQVADEARAAVERYDSVRQLVYPVGWNRKRTSVLAVRSEIEPSVVPATQETVVPTTQEPVKPTQGSVRLTVQDRYSRIYPTREQAAADEDLLPRSPQLTREEMLNDRTNPELESVELIVHYEARDGQWVRTGWEGPSKTTRGAGWMDQIGAP